MKKRVGIVLVMTALLLSGCTIVSPLELLEMASRANSEARAESDIETGNSETKPTAEAEKQEGGDETEDRGTRGNGDAAGGNQDKEGDSQDSDYERGIVTEEGWESEYWNLRFTLPEEVYMLTDDGIATVLELGGDIVSEEYGQTQKEYLDETILYEMMATTAETDANVIVMVEKLLVRGMSTENYKNAMVLQLMKRSNYATLEDTDTAEIAGETYALLRTKMEYESTYYQDYYVRVVDDRALCITITYTEETADKGEKILDGFDVY